MDTHCGARAIITFAGRKTECYRCSVCGTRWEAKVPQKPKRKRIREKR